MTDLTAFSACMARGSSLFEASQPEQALMAFQQALALQPLDVNAASACATLLSGLNQPQAAYQVLTGIKGQLWHDADGVANLAITAETCGLWDEARAAYHQALALNPNHVRTLNNLALWAARDGLWDDAVAKAGRCVALAPGEPMLWANWADFLTGAGREPEALVQLEQACERFPGVLDLAIRRMVSHAFNGQFDAAQQAYAALGPQAGELLDHFLDQATATLPKQLQKKSLTRLDMREFFAVRAFSAMGVCNWQHHDRLTELMGQMIDDASSAGTLKDWRDAQLMALLLPLSEDQAIQLRAIAVRTIDVAQKALPDFKGFNAARSVAKSDGRMRIGIATQALSQTRYANSLLRQMSLHDRAQFAIHLYTPGPCPPDLAVQLLGLGVSLVEMGHMTDTEAAARMRLDRLDLWMDSAFNTPWCRPELPALRVAPVQLRQQTWHRFNPATPCDYVIGDTFTHPGTVITHLPSKLGAVARFANTCWLSATPQDTVSTPLTRAEAHLPSDALVLCCRVPALMLDPETFAQWMRLLHALPDAVLWLPAYVPAAQANLRREATAAGIDTQRLVFADERTGAVATLPLADLFLDTLRFNANQGMVDALRMGVPAVSCAGHNMASRLGGSIIRAAGLADCVFETADAYIDAVIALGHNRPALAALRQRLQLARPTAPLFDTAARVKEWEAMWTHMVLRQRAGLPPASFEVPAVAPTLA